MIKRFGEAATIGASPVLKPSRENTVGKNRNSSVIRSALGVAILALSMAACSSSGNGGTKTSPGAKGTGGASPSGSSAEKVDLTFWSDANNMDKVVAVWNSQNPDIQVHMTDPGSTDDIVAKILAANQGGTAPDLADIPQASLSQLVVGGGAKDITSKVKDHFDVFAKGSVDAVTLDGKIYGVPLDVGPMMFVYRKDLLDRLGLQPPKTWDEFAQVAKTVHDKTGKYLTQLDPANYYLFTGMVEQAGGSWWSVKDGEWTVDIDGPASVKTADYWESLADAGTVSTQSDWTPAWSKALNDGSILSGPMAVWGVGTVTSLAPKVAGKWRAAPTPTWTGSSVVGQDGGSCTVITSSSKKVDAATKFVLWLEAGEGAKEIGKTQYPASIPAHDALTTPPVGIKGQTDFYELAGDAVKNLASVTWGPNTTVAFRTFTDEMTAAIKNHTPLRDALHKVQAAVVKDMKAKGFKVASG